MARSRTTGDSGGDEVDFPCSAAVLLQGMGTGEKAILLLLLGWDRVVYYVALVARK